MHSTIQSVIRSVILLRPNILLLGLCMSLTNFSHGENAQAATLNGSSASGIQIEIFSQLDPLQINLMHSWHIRLSESGGVISGASITMNGGMPEHDHGLPTQAQVTEELEPGLYLMEGIRFHMPGLWELQFSIEHGGRVELATIEFKL